MDTVLPFSYLLKNFFQAFFYLLRGLTIGSSNFFAFISASLIGGLSFYLLFIRRLK